MKSYGPQALSVVVCVVALAAGGCALRRSPQDQRGAEAARRAPQDDSLETAIEKIRKLQIAASPASAQQALMVETQAGELKGALELASHEPTGAAFRGVAVAYSRAGIRDLAYSYYARALKMNSKDAVAYDGMARIWRDWGLPELGLGDAYRATYYAPTSAAAYNTLGTVLHALGNNRDATRAFERALALEPGATYALNNVCYLSFLAGDSQSAIEACRNALTIDPALVPTRNNLALAFASGGDLAASASQFSQSGDAASRDFNLGIVYEAAGQFREAEGSFQAASSLRPEWGLAAERARQAHKLAEAQAPPSYTGR